MDRQQQFTKVDLKPKKWHGYTVFLFILGTLVPPLAVAARFGINSDFWLNVVLTICGYIPGHVHNFYIQNVRNNKNHRRTPKWAIQYGLIDTSAMERRAKRTQWAGRFNDRLPRSTHEGQAYEEGQEPRHSVDMSPENNGNEGANGGTAGLWKQDDEQYYEQNGDRRSIRTSGSSGRWRYPANFEGSTVDVNSSKKKKKVKKDRWARTEDAYSMEGGSSTERRKRRKSKKTKSIASDSDTRSKRSDSVTDFPEDAEGGLYGSPKTQIEPAPTTVNDDELFRHQF